MDKPYYSLDAYCKRTFHHKCYKIALNAHMSCPNRDGSLGTRGCIFCSQGGSGDFSIPLSYKNEASIENQPSHSIEQPSISKQLHAGRKLFGDKNVGEHYIAYFQAYTNTYAPVSYLRSVYTEALSCQDVCGISIATRPDCLPVAVLDLLAELKKEYPEKFIWVELGLQTIHESTANKIRRGYPLSTFDQAVDKLHRIQIPIIVHLIIGLPGETREMLLESISYLDQKDIFGLKLQLLHILKDTDLAAEYEAGMLTILEQDEYISLLIACLEHLSPDIVIHRLTGDGPKDLLLAPLWSREKRNVLNKLHREMKINSSYQGKYFTNGGPYATRPINSL